MTANAPTNDASEEEVKGGGENNQEKGGIKDNVTHSNINDHLRELNVGAGAKDVDTDNMEEYTTPRKNKSREIKRSNIDRKNKEKDKSHSPEPDSSPSILK